MCDIAKFEQLISTVQNVVILSGPILLLNPDTYFIDKKIVELNNEANTLFNPVFKKFEDINLSGEQPWTIKLRYLIVNTPELLVDIDVNNLLKKFDEFNQLLKNIHLIIDAVKKKSS